MSIDKIKVPVFNSILVTPDPNSKTIIKVRKSQSQNPTPLDVHNFSKMTNSGPV